MAKNIIFGPFGPNLGPKTFIVDFTSASSWTLFQAIILCHFKENQWTKLEKIVKNLIFNPILAPKLSLYANSKKTKEPNLRKWKKNYFWAHFGLFGQIFGPQNLFSEFFDIWHCCKLSLYPISRKTNDPKSKNCEKPHFGPNSFRPLWPKFGPPIFFFFFFFFFQKSGFVSH